MDTFSHWGAAFISVVDLGPLWHTQPDAVPSSLFGDVLGLVYPTATVILLLFGKGLSKRSSMRIGVPAQLFQQLDNRAGTFVSMESASLPAEAIDAVVVSEEQLLTLVGRRSCHGARLNAVPVIMLHDYVEAQTGRVDLKNFTFNDLFRVRSSDTYLVLKTVF